MIEVPVETSVVPVSEMGKCTGRFRLGEGIPLIAVQCYFDGSKGNDGSSSKWLTLAGYIGSDVFWGSFDGLWRKMLRERYPVAPYIHMYELLGHDDPFERVAGWTDDKISDLINDALNLLQQINRRAFCSFVCSVDVTAHTQLLEAGRAIDPPEVICAEWCINKALAWYAEEHPAKVEPAYIFFDRGEDFMRRFKDQWLAKRTPPGRVKRALFWDLIANVQDVDMKERPGIQASDMKAWALTRSLSERERPYQYLQKIIRGIVPTWELTLDRETLTEKHPPRSAGLGRNRQEGAGGT